MEQQVALFKAVGDGDVDELGRLLQTGQPADQHNSVGLTPLMLAAVTAREPLIAPLVSAGASLEARGSGGATALMLCLGAGNIAVATRLLDLGADVNSRDNVGRTPLFYAVEQSRGPTLPLVNLLLDRGADRSVQDKWGRTALELSQRRQLDLRIPFVKSSEITVHWSWPFGKTVRVLRQRDVDSDR